MIAAPRKILYLQYTNPAGFPPLQHSSSILAEAGWEVLFLGAAASGAEDLELPPHPRIQTRQLGLCAGGWRQKLRYVRFCLWCLWWTLRWKPDWIYASDLFTCPAALLAKTFSASSLLYHEHDSPNPESVSHPDNLFLRFCVWTRRRCASLAALCVLPNQRRAERFQEQTKGAAPVHVVWNCPSRNEARTTMRDPAGDTLRILYHGSLGPARLPLAVIRALASLPEEVCLRVVGYETVGSFGYMDQVAAFARSLGIEQRIEYLGAIPLRSDLLAICDTCDVGLALLPLTTTDINLTAMTGASNKAFDYLGCGLPLIVSDQEDWRRLYCDPGYGLACNPADWESVAGAIGWYQEHRDLMREMGERGRRRVLSEWNYETQLAPVLSVLGAERERMNAYPDVAVDAPSEKEARL